jgi:hypothetical protein
MNEPITKDTEEVLVICPNCGMETKDTQVKGNPAVYSKCIFCGCLCRYDSARKVTEQIIPVSQQHHLYIYL